MKKMMLLLAAVVVCSSTVARASGSAAQTQAGERGGAVYDSLMGWERKVEVLEPEPGEVDYRVPREDREAFMNSLSAYAGDVASFIESLRLCSRTARGARERADAQADLSVMAGARDSFAGLVNGKGRDYMFRAETLSGLLTTQRPVLELLLRHASSGKSTGEAREAALREQAEAQALLQAQAPDKIGNDILKLKKELGQE